MIHQVESNKLEVIAQLIKIWFREELQICFSQQIIMHLF